MRSWYSTNIGTINTANSSIHPLTRCAMTFSLHMNAVYLKDGHKLEGPVTWRSHLNNKCRSWKTDMYLSIASDFAYLFFLRNACCLAYLSITVRITCYMVAENDRILNHAHICTHTHTHQLYSYILDLVSVNSIETYSSANVGTRKYKLYRKLYKSNVRCRINALRGSCKFLFNTFWIIILPLRGNAV